MKYIRSNFAHKSEIKAISSRVQVYQEKNFNQEEMHLSANFPTRKEPIREKQGYWAPARRERGKKSEAKISKLLDGWVSFLGWLVTVYFVALIYIYLCTEE